MILILFLILNKGDKLIPNLSIIIPTLNESQNLPLILSDLSEIFDKSEILIIDSTSKDKTEDIANIYGTKFFRVNQKNRGLQLNFGAKRSVGKWLLFIHADSRLSSDWSDEIKKVMEIKPYSIYFFKFKLKNKNLIFRLLELFVNIRCFIFRNPYGDQGILINKKVFTRNNGFKEIPLMEDIDFINRVKKRESLFPLRNYLFTSSRKWEKVNVISQSIKNWHFRRRWAKGESLQSIYDEYYKITN